MLVEAKAHDYELRKEEQGKSLSATSSEESRRNHEQIGLAIQAANRSLSVETKLPWSLSRDAGYQMSNRFAWAWKVTQLGILVILAYLGFVGCEEMRRGKTIQPIASQEEWEKLVQNHSRPLFPDEVWNQQWRVQDKSFIPVILTTDQPLSRG